jgi:hypothetical protein
MSFEQSRDINKFANMFGSKQGTISVEKMFSNYFRKSDRKLTNKTERIVFLLDSNKSDIKELQYIIQQILDTNGGWQDNVGIMNDTIRSLGLKVNPDSYHVEIISQKGVEDIFHEMEKEATEKLKLDRLLPSEIIDEGKRMAESYLLIYCFENTLRIFIDKIFIEKYGEDYWSKLEISNDIKDAVSKRKRSEEKNQFHSLRGSKELFYLDMDHLFKIMEHNWNIFKSFFPSQDFIRTRISETVITRNHVAHNGWISEDDFNRVLVYYKDILRQLGQLS